MEMLITTIPKSGNEEIHIALSEFEANGTVHQMASARVFFEDGKEYRPGRNGINLKIEFLPALVAALSEALRVARENDLLDGKGAGDG